MALLRVGKDVPRQFHLASRNLLASRAASNVTMTPVLSQTHERNFWEKNKELSRPMSPHLSIYKPQVTSVLSITHRFTGLGAAAVLYGGGMGTLLFSGVSFPEIVQAIQTTIPQPLILTTKAAIAGAVVYHTLNGVRHLVWDIGYGFQLKHLYISGYIVVALTALGTALVFIKG